MTDQAPLVQVHCADVAAAALTADSSSVVIAEYDGVVTGVTYTPIATMTGAATNNRTLSVVNHGSDGSGTTVVASLNFASGVSATAFDEKSITLSTTAADRVVASGDVLECKSLHVLTGIVDPSGSMAVTISRS